MFCFVFLLLLLLVVLLVVLEFENGSRRRGFVVVFDVVAQKVSYGWVGPRGV